MLFLPEFLSRVSFRDFSTMPTPDRIRNIRSSVPGKVPTAEQLGYGELAINFADEKIYFKNTTNNIVSIGTSATLSIAPDTTNKAFYLPLMTVADAEIGHTSGLKYVEGLTPTLDKDTGEVFIQTLKVDSLHVDSYAKLPPIVEWDNTVNRDVTIRSNAISGANEVIVAEGVTITVEDGATWTVGTGAFA